MQPQNLVYKFEYEYPAYAHSGQPRFAAPKLVRVVDWDATRIRERAIEIEDEIRERIGDEKYDEWLDCQPDDTTPAEDLAAHEKFLAQLDDEAEFALSDMCPTAHAHTEIREIVDYSFPPDPPELNEICLDCGASWAAWGWGKQ